jgi:hypothetical protein
MKHSNLTFAVALGFTSLIASDYSHARESISSVSARLSTLENQLQLTTDLANCGNTFAKAGEISNELPIVDPTTGNILFKLPIPSPATGGILVDADAYATWDYGYMGTQLYTNDEGQLACGAVVNMQALVESVMDVGLGSICAGTAIAAMSKDPKAETADSVICSVIDNVVRASNALFWLGVSGAERKDELDNSGSPEAIKGPRADLYKVSTLTLGIPQNEAELIALIKAQAIDAPLAALSEGKLVFGDIEIPFDQLMTPFEIVQGELETNGTVLLSSPAQFVAETAAVVAEYYFDEIVNPELIQAVIDAASKLDFVDGDGNEVFGMALTTEGAGPALNTMAFKLQGAEVMKFSNNNVGVTVGATSFDVGASSLSLNIEGTSVITASTSEVCLLGVCINDDLLSLSGVPVDLESQLSTLTSGVASLNGLVPSNLPTQLSVLSSGLAGLQTIVPVMQGQLGTLNTNYGTLSNTASVSAGHINTLWGTLYNPGGVRDLATGAHSFMFSNTGSGLGGGPNGTDGGMVGRMSATTALLTNTITPQLNALNNAMFHVDNIVGKGNAIWELVHGSGQRLARVDQLHHYMFVDTGTGFNGPDGNPATGDGGIFDRMNQTTALLNAAVNGGGLGASIIGHIPNSIPYVPYISDARLKNNIVPLTSSLDNILLLQGVTHQWNEQAVALGIQVPDRTVLGFIAQEVQQVVPELIYEGSDGYLRVDYPKMVPMVVEGIKDQQTQIAQLQQENEQLKTYLCSLDSTAPFCGN